MFLSKDEIVKDIVSKLDQQEILYLKKLSEENVGSMHHSFGTYIRNEYKLWEKENPLTEAWHAVAGTDHEHMIDGVDHHPLHPDQFSYEIMIEVWKEVQCK